MSHTDVKLIGERIKYARSLRNRTLDDVANDIGVTKSTIQRYENGLIGKPKIPVLESIAKSLRVNPSWVSGKNVPMEYRSLNFPTKPDDCPFNSALAKLQNNDYSLTQEEQEALEERLPSVMERATKALDNFSYKLSSPYEVEKANELLKNFVLLNSVGKDKAIEQVTLLTKIPDYQDLNARDTSHTTIIEFHPKPKSKIIALPYFRAGVSAGTGIFILGNEAEDDIELPALPEYEAADFAIDVNGDSMEPDFSHEDIALVQRDAEMHIGDIGVFIVNGDAFIKELGEKELISRNKDYKNIPIHEGDNVVCMGKVIGKVMY